MKKTLFLLTVIAAFVALGFTAQNAYAQGAVTGVVVNADGDAVEGAVVTIQSAVRVRGERPFRARFVTEENGVFGWRQVPEGRYRITAAARQLGGVREMIGVRDGQVTRVELQLQGRGERERPEIEFGSVVGQVVNADGEPVEGAIVTVAVRVQVEGRRGVRRVGLRTRTNERGVFEFERVPAGNAVIRAVARRVGRAAERIEVVADEVTRVRLELQGRGG